MEELYYIDQLGIIRLLLGISEKIKERISTEVEFETVENPETGENITILKNPKNFPTVEAFIDYVKAWGELSVYKGNNRVNSITEFGTTYTFKLGSNIVATINLAKCEKISSGQVITATGNENDTQTTLITGEKYIRLVVENSTDENNIYIPVNSLYKDYTVEQNANKILLSISDDNEISAQVIPGSITKSDLHPNFIQELEDNELVVSTALNDLENRKVNKSSLANVATSGLYTDLINKPLIITHGDLGSNLNNMKQVDMLFL